MKQITSGEPDRLIYQQKGGRDVLRGQLGEDKRQMNGRTDVGGHHRLDMMGLPGWVLKGRPASLRTEGIIHVQSNKVWCIITVQFSSWKEIESFRREQRGKEREVDKQVNKGEKSKERKPTVASLFLLSWRSKLDSEAPELLYKLCLCALSSFL